MKVPLFLFCFLSSHLMAQTYLSLYGALNPRTEIFNEQENILERCWRNGVSIGAAYEKTLSKNIIIASSIESAYYKWDNFNYGGVSIPEISLKSANGEDSRVWRFFLEVKLMPTSKDAPVYLSTGVGYINEIIGSITARYSDMNGPEFTRTQSRYTDNYFVHTLGIGMKWFFISDFGMDIRTLYYSNYSNRFQLAMLLAFSYSL